MSQVIWKNTATAELRRIYLLIYSDADGTTPWTGNVSGVKAQLSYRGATETASNADIVRVNANGALHYIELLQTESNVSTGPITARVGGVTGRLESVGIAEIVAYDPFAAGPSAVDIRSEMDSNSTSFAALLSADIAYKKNTGVSNFLFYMALAATGAPATGKTVTVQISKDGAAFATVGGAVTEVSDGWYKIATLSATEMNADEIAFKATAADAAQGNWKLRTQA